MIKYVMLTLLLCNTLKAQETITTEFYKITIPEEIKIQPFNNLKEESANTDGYKVFNNNNRPKYIFYLISNKLNVQTDTINVDNFKSYIFDLGDIEITSFDSRNMLFELSFRYKDNDKTIGIMYLSINNNILNRFVFILPNFPEIYNTYGNEIMNLVNNIRSLKTEW